MYTPVAQRKTVSTATGGYTPVAERATLNETDASPLPTKIDLGSGPEFTSGHSAPGVKAMSPVMTMPAETISVPNDVRTPYNSTTSGIIKNTFTGLPAASLKVAKGVLNFGEDVLQGIARSVGSAALTVSGRFGTKDGSNVADPIKPEDFHNNFTQALFENVFGKNTELKPIETRIAEAEPKVKEWGSQLDKLASEPNLNPRERLVVQTLSDLTKKHPNSVSFIGIMGSVGMDLTAFGGLEENAFKQIVNTRNLGEAKILAQKLGIADDLLDNFAEQVVKTNSTQEAKKLLTNTADLMQTTKVGTKKVAEEGVTDIPYSVPGDKPKMYLPVAERQPSLMGDMDAAANYAKETRPEIKATLPSLPKVAPKYETSDVIGDAYYKSKIEPKLNSGEVIEVSGDEMKKHLGEDYAPERSALYSKAAFDTVKKLLSSPKMNDFVFLGGGSGSGKSEFLGKSIKADNSTQVLYDNSFSSEEGTKELLDLAKKNGKRVQISAILTDLEDAHNYTKIRETKTGRSVSIDDFARSHSQFIQSLRNRLLDGSLKKANVHLYDFRNVKSADEAREMVENGKFVENPLAILESIKYDENTIKNLYGKNTTTKSKGFPVRQKSGGRRSEVSRRDGPVQKEVSKAEKVNQAAERAKAGEDFGPRTSKEKAPKKERGVSIPKNVKIPEKLAEQQSQIEGFNEMIAQARERLSNHPGKKLQQYISRKEGIFEDFKNPDLAKTISEKEAIIERNHKIMAEAEKQFEGTKFAEEFDNPDTIRESIDEYRELKERLDTLSKQRVEAKRAFYEARKEFYTEELDRRAMNSIVARQERVKVLEEVEKILRKEGRDRKEKIDAVADFFNLTDAEMKKLNTGNKDFRLMSDKEFENHLKGIEGKAYEVAAHREAVLEIENTIKELELLKVDNLREAMKLKQFENMSKNELDAFNDLLQTFKKGDEFLGKRQLQTVRFTDMADIKTRREALEFLAKEAKVPIEELKNVKVSDLDKFLYDNPLARKNPFYKVMVDNVNLAEVEASGRFFEVKNQTEKLITEARASRKKSLIDKLIPTDKMIFDYLEGDSDTKLELAKRMTPQEYKAASYIRDKYEEVRDYLLEQEVLKKNQYKRNYITHTRRDFLEAWKESTKDLSLAKGFKDAVKEMFDAYKEQAAVFNILDSKTGEVLPLEKFFKFSITRKGNLVPTKNVSKAFLEYMRVFEQKRQLDSFIPKLDIFAHVLSPTGTTQRGLDLDDSLKRFVKTWINSKKGRTMDWGIAKQGAPIDWALRSGVALTRLLDLGLNIPVGLASNVGEQTFNFIELGSKKYATGLVRYATKQGRNIVNSYENIVGEKFFEKMADTSKSAGEKFHEGIFSLFSSANRRGNAIHLLADMTPEEFLSGKLSTQKLAEIRNNIAKYHVVPGKESIIGKTSFGSVGKQYKSWAVPAFHTSIDNLKKVGQMAKAKDFKGIFHSKESAELFRGTILTAALLVTSYDLYNKLQNKKDRSFLENLAYKSMNDALSFIGALNPSFWTSPTRLQQFVNDLGVSLTNIATSLATGSRTKEGDIQGVKKLKSTVTPAIIKQASSAVSSDDSGGFPKISGLPSLPKLPSLPSLPKLPSLK